MNKNVKASTSFADMLKSHGISRSVGSVRTLQVNLGRICNQSCNHCHLEAGPGRTESMDMNTIERLISLASSDSSIETVDITGGAPEMNPHFRFLVETMKSLGKRVMCRTNLTILTEEGYGDLTAFYADNGVELIASLPCYLEENVDRQRGSDVFAKSIDALRRLNSLGYGKEGSGLILNLVFNPGGASLPPDQLMLEGSYKSQLYDNYGISFNSLFTLANMPISRFREKLERDNCLESYMELLTGSFNPFAADTVMCRSQVSIGWDGRIFNCDFNQALDLGLRGPSSDIWGIDSFSSIDPEIVLGDHCYGCTAGSGSSCGGSLV